MQDSSKVTCWRTFLPDEPLCWLQVSDAGALIFGVVGTLPGVPQHLGEGHFEMLLHSVQVEIPVEINNVPLTDGWLEWSMPTPACTWATYLVLKNISVVSSVEGEWAPSCLHSHSISSVTWLGIMYPARRKQAKYSHRSWSQKKRGWD